MTYKILRGDCEHGTFVGNNYYFACARCDNNVALLHSCCDIFEQVFFCVLFCSMALGNTSPNVQAIGQARAAAYVIWEIIDRVRKLLDQN